MSAENIYELGKLVCLLATAISLVFIGISMYMKKQLQYKLNKDYGVDKYGK